MRSELEHDDPEAGNFLRCFSNFDFDQVAAYGETNIERIMNTEGMIRSRRKIEAVIHNARCFQKIRAEFGSFSEYIWGFTKGKTYLYMGHQKGDVPARNGLSDRISADLKKWGLRYMGSITVYSHLQACGIINDHWRGAFDTKSSSPVLTRCGNGGSRRTDRDGSADIKCAQGKAILL